MARILRITVAAFALIAVVIVLSINQSLAGFGESLFPGASTWIHWGLLAFEGIGFIWLGMGIFGRQKHLVFAAEATPEQHQEFVRELTRRLRKNPHVKAALREGAGDPTHPLASLKSSDPAYQEQCLVILRKKADEEIHRTAERVFLATALSQNGRIDAAIVFVTLCRLIWRISDIYNQRPHPRELASLYWAVATSTFLALSFEELDVSAEITVGFGEAFHAMAPATMTGSVPFVGTALQKFTSSAIDGAANCFLALRAGIITRNAYAYPLECAHEPDSETVRVRPTRLAVYKESSALLLGMSNRLIDQFTRHLGEKLRGLTKAAQARTFQAGQNMAVSVAGTAVKTGNVMADAAAKTGDAMAGAIAKTGSLLAASFRKKNP